MNRPTRWAACAVLVLGSLVPVTASQGVACASESARAVLVVDTGENVYSYCVELPDGSVTGLELIALASEQHGLSYRLGFGGEAVCMLAGVGPTGDDCFEDYPDFWGYWRGSSGGWSWASSGAGSTSVGDGDVEGWSWGSGNDGATHQRPPDTSFSEVCPAAPRSGGQRPPRSSGGGQKRAPERTAQEPPSPGPAGVTATRSGRLPTTSEATAPSVRTPRRKPPHRKENGPRPTRREETPPRDALEAPAVSPTPGAVLASRTTPEEGRSVPTGGLAALALAAAFGVGGVVIARRRRGRW